MQPDNTPLQAKQDDYRTARGGASKFLDIICGGCGTPVAIYQKDGGGPLWRCYLDRIFAPPELAALQHTAKSRRDIPDFVCPNCGRLLGVADVYEPENRLCIRLRRGQVVKRVRS